MTEIGEPFVDCCTGQFHIFVSLYVDASFFLNSFVRSVVVTEEVHEDYKLTQFCVRIRENTVAKN